MVYSFSLQEIILRKRKKQEQKKLNALGYAEAQTEGYYGFAYYKFREMTNDAGIEIVGTHDNFDIMKKYIAAPDTWAAGEVEQAKKNGLLADNTSKYYKLDINHFEFAELIVTCIEKTLKKTIISAPYDTFTDTE